MSTYKFGDTGVRLSSQISNTGIGTAADILELDLFTYTLPANSLVKNNQGIRITCWGATAANANGKTIRVKFGAGISTTTTAVNNTKWMAIMEIYRVGISSQEWWVRFHDGVTTTGPILEFNTATDIETAGIILKVTGQNSVASGSDIVAHGMTVDFINI